MKCLNLNLGGGELCNRLRTLYSHYTYCLENGLNLAIYNIPTDYCDEFQQEQNTGLAACRFGQGISFNYCMFIVWFAELCFSGYSKKWRT